MRGTGGAGYNYKNWQSVGRHCAHFTLVIGNRPGFDDGFDFVAGIWQIRIE